MIAEHPPLFSVLLFLAQPSDITSLGYVSLFRRLYQHPHCGMIWIDTLTIAETPKDISGVVIIRYLSLALGMPH